MRANVFINLYIKILSTVHKSYCYQQTARKNEVIKILIFKKFLIFRTRITRVIFISFQCTNKSYLNGVFTAGFYTVKFQCTVLIQIKHDILMGGICSVSIAGKFILKEIYIFTNGGTLIRQNILLIKSTNLLLWRFCNKTGQLLQVVFFTFRIISCISRLLIEKKRISEKRDPPFFNALSLSYNYLYVRSKT